MSRTINQIYEEIVAYKDAQTPLAGLMPASDTATQFLADLTSVSKVAIWRLWAYITAAAIYVHEALWAIFKAEVDAVVLAAHGGTARWLKDRILEYQHGDGLIFDSASGKYVYDPVDASHRIITQCAVVEGNNGVVIIKLAKGDVGSLEALTNPEKDGATSYVKKRRMAGMRFSIVTGDGDIIRIEATVYFDAVYTQPVVSAAVQAAVVAYLEGLPFNGEFLVSKLTDSIQSVAGVNDVVIVTVQTKTSIGGTYEQVIRNHVPLYGYYKVDSTAGNTLSDTIIYVAQ